MHQLRQFRCRRVQIVAERPFDRSPVNAVASALSLDGATMQPSACALDRAQISLTVGLGLPLCVRAAVTRAEEHW